MIIRKKTYPKAKFVISPFCASAMQKSGGYVNCRNFFMLFSF